MYAEAPEKQVKDKLKMKKWQLFLVVLLMFLLPVIYLESCSIVNITKKRYWLHILNSTTGSRELV